MLSQSSFGDSRSVKPQTTSLLHLSTAPLWVCSIYWTSQEACWACYNTDMLSEAVGALGTASVVCGRKGRRAARAEGIVTLIPTFCLKPLIWFIIFHPMVYIQPILFASQMSSLLRAN